MFGIQSVKSLAALPIMLALLLLSANRVHAQGTSPITDTRGVTIVNNLPIIWTPSNVWAGQQLVPPSVLEVRTPSGVSITARGIIAAGGRALIWTATNVYLVTMPNLAIEEVRTPAGGAIVDTQGATTVGTPPMLPVIWTSTNVYAIRLFTPLTVTEITKPNGSPISGARRAQGTPGIPIIWTATNVYAARMLEPLDVAEIRTPLNTPISDTRGMAVVAGKPVIWTPSNVYAVHTLQPVDVREVRSPTNAPVTGTQGITVIVSVGRAVIRTTSNVYGLVQVSPPQTNEIRTPGNVSISGARGAVAISSIGRAVIWNGTNVYGLMSITIPQTNEIRTPAGAPINDVRGVAVIENLGRALIWNATNVYGLLNITTPQVNEIRTPAGAPIGGTQGAIEVEVINNIARAVIWNGTNVYGLLNISIPQVNEIRDPAGAAIGATLDVAAIGAAGRAVIWNPTNVYALTNITIPQVAEIRRPGGPPPTFTLSVNRQGNGNGTVFSKPAGINCPPTCSVNVAAGTAMNVLPSAAPGSVFVGWSGCDSVAGTTCSVTMNANKTVTATFNLQTFTLTVAKAGGGSGLVTGTPPGINCGLTCSANYNSGTQVTLTANPDTGSDFMAWSGCDSVSGTMCTVAINATRGVTATFELRAATGLVRGPYLQSGTPTSVIVKWRTGEARTSRACYNTALTPSGWSCANANPSGTTDHEINLTGLAPSTKYYYYIGTQSGTIWAGPDANHFFMTSPPTGQAKPTRIWVIGNSGTADTNAAAVRDAYLAFTGSRGTDLWLMLGDNALNDGTDQEYQAAVFDMYRTLLRQTVLWPTLGNHDGESADSATETGPYYDIFSLPRWAEAGGVPSGTEAYYSFDYGNVHFISLESFETDRSTGGSMLTWLEQDLAATTQPWIIAFWHHPPYSKGSHDSDNLLGWDPELVEMRENALSILEAWGVDLVLTGHSHSYERSCLLDGHYGYSWDWTPEMCLARGNDFVKPAPPASRAGAVYAVAGSSGKMSGGSLDHPVMDISRNALGSLVLDVNDNRLEARFLDQTGATLDSFTIVKGASSTPPGLVPIEDAYISQAEPDANFGTLSTLRADGDDPPDTGQDLRALLQWDVSSIPPSSTVTSATISSNITNPSSGTYQVYALAGPWNEAVVTWETRPVRGTDILGEMACPALGRCTFSLNSMGLAIVQGWVNGSIPNYGLVILNTDAIDGVAFESRQAGTASNRPILTLTVQ